MLNFRNNASLNKSLEMSSLTIKPAQIFAAISSSSEPRVPICNVTTQQRPLPTMQISNDTGNRTHEDRILQVTSVGELSLAPDVCECSMNVSSSKDNVQDAKNSVSRRLDYILQTLRNHQIKDGDFKVHQSLQKSQGTYIQDAEVVVRLNDISRFHSVSNLLVEKLDDHVRIGTPVFRHSDGKLETIRQQASVLAVKQCKQKALELADVVNAKVGRAISVREDSIDEWEGLTESSQPMTMKQSIEASTVHVRAKVTVTFELLVKKKRKEEKI